MADEKKTERFLLAIEPSLIRAIDEWRSRQTGLPSRARAIRTLVANGLLTDGVRERLDAALKTFVLALKSGETDPEALGHLDRLLVAKTSKDRNESWGAYRSIRDLGP